MRRTDDRREMKFGCPCGTTIADQTDHLPYKASFVPDESMDDVYEAVEKALVSDEPEDVLERDRFFDLLGDPSVFIDAYQCPECGRLFISNKLNGFYVFLPDGHERRDVLRGRKK